MQWAADSGLNRASLVRGRSLVSIFHALIRRLKRMWMMNQNNQTRKILVVDDDPVIRDMMADILEFEGYTISIARNGSEALQMLRSDEDYLVFLDIMMPVMSGRELCALMSASVHLRRGGEKMAAMATSGASQLPACALMSTITLVREKWSST